MTGRGDWEILGWDEAADIDATVFAKIRDGMLLHDVVVFDERPVTATEIQLQMQEWLAHEGTRLRALHNAIMWPLVERLLASWPRIYTVKAPRTKHGSRRKARRAMAFARRRTATRVKTHLPRGWAR